MKRFLIAALACSVVVNAQAPDGIIVAPANGEPAGAIALALGINPNAPSGIDTATFTNVGEPDPLSAGLAPIPCGDGPNSDVFFSFSAGNNANYTFATCTPGGFTAGSHTDTILQVLTADGQTSLACDDDTCFSPGFASQVTLPLTAGANVLVRVSSWDGTPDGSFYISVSEMIPPMPPVNDTCAGAIPLSEGLNGPFDNTLAVLANEVGFDSPCGVFGSVLGFRDLFFTYTPDCDGNVTIASCDGDSITSPGENDDTQLMAYDVWTCGMGPNTPIACNDDGAGSTCGPNGYQSTITFPVVANQTYLVRLAAWGSGDIGTNVLNVTLSTAQLITIGTGCGSPNAATLVGSNPPVLGQPGTITVTAQPNSNGLLLYSAPNFANAYTPFFGGCTIYVTNPGFGVLLPIFTDAFGTWSFTETFPSDPAYEKFTVDLQALVIGAAGFEFSNGLRLVFGT